ncbi:BON domain-containing protein [bacterium]|nr:MAG: BON domain-containing protein [bacterium]
MKLTNFALAALFGAALLGGCTQEAREKYDSAGDSASNAVKKTGDAVSTDVQKTGDAVEAGAKEVAQEAKDVVKAPDTTFKVRTALEQGNLEIKDLNVDSNADTKTVTLKGMAPNADSKKRAGDIAKPIADGQGMKVDNQITVG